MCVCMQDPAVVHWVNGVLLQSLDPILLPVYLDVLQVLKAKVCAVHAHRLEEGGGARGEGPVVYSTSPVLISATVHS